MQEHEYDDYGDEMSPEEQRLIKEAQARALAEEEARYREAEL